MSAELTVKMGLAFAKGGAEIHFNPDVDSIDVAGNNYSEGTLDLTTSYEAIPKGDIATLGVCGFQNLGSNPIHIREDLTGDARLVVKPGETWFVRVDNTGFATPGAKASTGTSRLKYLLIED